MRPKMIEEDPFTAFMMAKFNANYEAIAAYERESRLPSFSRIPNFGVKKGGD